MSLQEFHSLDRVLGWKYEYLEGLAVITPFSCPVGAVLNLAGAWTDSFSTSPPCESDTYLKELYIEAFSSTVEYAGVSPSRIRELAGASLKSHFNGDRGLPRAESKVFRRGKETLGAALIVQKAHGPHLDLLMVAPKVHRSGVGGSLLASVALALLQAGETRLTSAYQLANTPSKTWHTRHGFREIPNRYSEETRLRHLLRGTGSPEEIASSGRALEWLRELEKKHGPTAAHTVNRLLLPGGRDGVKAPAWLVEVLEDFCSEGEGRVAQPNGLRIPIRKFAT